MKCDVVVSSSFFCDPMDEYEERYIKVAKAIPPPNEEHFRAGCERTKRRMLKQLIVPCN